MRLKQIMTLAQEEPMDFTEEQLEKYVQQRIQEALGAPFTLTAQRSLLQKQQGSIGPSSEQLEEHTQQHIYHHNDADPRIAMKVEKNTKGYNWEVSVSGAKTVEEALVLIQRGNDELKAAYGDRP